MQIVWLQDQLKLLLRERYIHARQRNSMKCEIPCGVPGILPLVRHRDDVAVDHVDPFAVAYSARSWFHRIGSVILQPLVKIEIEVLLSPKHPRKGLPEDACIV